MPPTHDRLDRDYAAILCATLAACAARNYIAECCAVVTGHKGTLYGTTSFHRGVSVAAMASAETFVLKDRMIEWIDYFITAGVLIPGLPACVHVQKDLMDGGLPGITVFMWTGQ